MTNLNDKELRDALMQMVAEGLLVAFVRDGVVLYQEPECYEAQKGDMPVAAPSPSQESHE